MEIDRFGWGERPPHSRRGRGPDSPRIGTMPSSSIQQGPRRMTIEISRELRQQAITSIERYFRENMEEPIGNVAAGALLGFFLEEIGPTIYNKAVADVQERLQARVSEVDLEVHEDEFRYWHKFDKQKKGR
jgi:uncharacterized protein (DUF2164 family)